LCFRDGGLPHEVNNCAEQRQLGNAEIEQLDRPVAGHEDFARFQIAVDDQVVVSVPDGGADLLEQLQSFGDRRLALIAVFGDSGDLRRPDSLLDLWTLADIAQECRACSTMSDAPGIRLSLKTRLHTTIRPHFDISISSATAPCASLSR
jgi:hypothetical protein